MHIGPLRRQMRAQGKYQFSFDKAPTLDEITRVYLDRLLAEKDRSRAEIAETLGVSERNLYRMLRGRQE